MVRATAVLLCLLAPRFVAVSAQRGKCIVETAQNGSIVKVRGVILSGGHDLILRPEQCPESRVIVVYGDDARLEKDRLKVNRNDSFRLFKHYLEEQQPAKPNVYCQSCPKYQVTADFTGRLDVAASAGLKRDPTTGKAIGLEGFGDPMPFSRFRLVVTEISKVEAKEITSQ